MKRTLVLLGIFMLGAGALRAQFIEDGLRIATPNAYYSPRQGALGLSFLGIGDDAAALFMNPAALTFAQQQEFNFGFTMHRVNTTNIGSEGLTGVNNYAGNDYINNIALTAPASPNLKVGIGYSATSLFDNDLEWTLFNRNSTFIDWRAAQDKSLSADDNMMRYLGIANDNSYTPLVNNLEQKEMTQEQGGMDVINAGLSYDFNENLAGGLSVAFKFGSYDYNRIYTETDINNIYNFNDVEGFTNIDFSKFTLNQTVQQDVFGLGMTLGLAGRAGEGFRWSVAVELPTNYSINESFTEDARVEYDNGDKTTTPWGNSGQDNAYTVRTPFVYSAGASYHYEGLTLAGGVNYTDLSQMEMNDLGDAGALNNDIKRQLKEVFTYSFGAEYKIPELPVFARLGYEKRSSPWAAENVDGSRTTFSGGVGVVIGSNVRIDGIWRTFSSEEQRSAYGNEGGPNANAGVAPLINQFKNTIMQFGLGLTWRFSD